MDGEHTYVFRDRDQLDSGIYRQALLHLEEFFHSPDHRLQGIRNLARQIKNALENISPLIQETTRAVCPHCADVCCISKHGFYNYEDLVYLFALGLRPPFIDLSRNDHDPCQFLTENGCSMERVIRPSGCNWYFCNPLLEVLEKRPDYRDFDASLMELAELWMKMSDEFSKFSPLRPS